MCDDKKNQKPMSMFKASHDTQVKPQKNADAKATIINVSHTPSQSSKNQG